MQCGLLPQGKDQAPPDMQKSGTLRFTLRCIPTPQQRPRHMRTRSGIDLTYKSRAQKNSEATLDALLSAHVPEMPLEGGIELRFRAIMPVPKSASKKKKEAMLRGFIGHTVKPDLDNLCKQLKDAMTRLRFWHDDRQVVRIYGEKVYGPDPCWIVSAQSITETAR